jgi:gliding motility-associated-like protein
MKSLLLPALLIFVAFSVRAQKEATVWYFGHKAGIDFNAWPPAALTNSAMVANSAAAVLADRNGNLLFYTNGNTVWNREHQVMLNGTGLLGYVKWEFDEGTVVPVGIANDALIVPFPARENQFYIFYNRISAGGMPDTLSYALVDLERNGGLGEVLQKNQLVRGPLTSKIAATSHANCRDSWILVQDYDSNRLVAYQLTPEGLMPPVVSAVGGITRGVDYEGKEDVLQWGRMKFSRDGRKLVVVNGSGNLTGFIELFDFDPATGVVSNPLRLAIPADNGGQVHLRGVEFSPDNTKIYYTNVMDMYQYDLTAAEQPLTLLTPEEPYRGTWWDMQLGPDGRIYAASVTTTFLGVINNPDAPGLGCGFDPTGFDLAGRLSSSALPAFLPTYFYRPEAAFSVSDQCVGASTQFRARTRLANAAYRWDFGDPASGGANYSPLADPEHRYEQPGTYSVQLIVQVCEQTDTVTQQITIAADPLIAFGQDTLSVCYDRVPVNLAVTEHAAAAYQWSSGQTSASIAARESGWYKVTASNACRSRSDSIYLQVIGQATAYLPDDTVVCEGVFAVLDARNPGATYRWNTGETTQTIQATRPGEYWVEIRNECSMAVDTANLYFIPEDVSRVLTNVFTPNGDSKNDRFVNYVLASPEYRMQIVNRWGRVVFASTDPFEFWDGRVNGEEAPTGVYFYHIHTRDCRGNPLQLRGSVSLLR